PDRAVGRIWRAHVARGSRVRLRHGTAAALRLAGRGGARALDRALERLGPHHHEARRPRWTRPPQRLRRVPRPGRGRSRAADARRALARIILLACLLAAGSWRVYSNTWDEPEHLAAGVELLDRGRYEYDTEHPPLARVLLALGPYLAGAHSFGTPPPNGTPEG